MKTLRNTLMLLIVGLIPFQFTSTIVAVDDSIFERMGWAIDQSVKGVVGCVEDGAHVIDGALAHIPSLFVAGIPATWVYSHVDTDIFKNVPDESITPMIRVARYLHEGLNWGAKNVVEKLKLNDLSVSTIAKGIQTTYTTIKESADLRVCIAAALFCGFAYQLKVKKVDIDARKKAREQFKSSFTAISSVAALAGFGLLCAYVSAPESATPATPQTPAVPMKP